MILVRRGGMELNASLKEAIKGKSAIPIIDRDGVLFGRMLIFPMDLDYLRIAYKTSGIYSENIYVWLARVCNLRKWIWVSR